MCFPVGMCQRIKTERVLYDQRLFITENETDVPLDLGGATLVGVTNPVIQIDILDCDVDFGDPNLMIPPTVTLRANFIIEFTGSLSDGTTRNFEFSFIRTFGPFTLPKLDVTGLTPDELRRAFCQIFDITMVAPPVLTFDAVAGTFDILIQAAVKLKLVVFDQIMVALCPPANSVVLSGTDINVQFPD